MSVTEMRKQIQLATCEHPQSFYSLSRHHFDLMSDSELHLAQLCKVHICDMCREQY